MRRQSSKFSSVDERKECENDKQRCLLLKESAAMSETTAGIETRHRKELKSLDGEKRAAIKKAKSTAGKGKKAKEMMAAVEAEYDEKIKEMQERHKKELQNLSGEAEVAEDDAAPEDNEMIREEEEKQRKQDKARRKREKQRQKELQREREIAEETANAGPAPRDMENEIIRQKLTPLNMQIREVEADGHCLYRAIAAQSDSDYQAIRHMCADTLRDHQEDFAPFCEYTEKAPDYQAYVDRVRNSADWGGHLELRAISLALKRPILVYSAQSTDPLLIEHDGDDDRPIRLSYHLQYYSLGEHYNRVVVNGEDQN